MVISLLQVHIIGSTRLYKDDIITEHDPMQDSLIAASLSKVLLCILLSAAVQWMYILLMDLLIILPSLDGSNNNSDPDLVQVYCSI